MARIAGVDLPRNKQARIALTYIYGIGDPRAAKILEKANVNAFKKIQDLTEEEVNHIRQVIEDEGGVEGDLRKDVQMHIKRLIDIQSYRGNRQGRQEQEVQEARTQERAIWSGAHSGFVQQHDRDHHGQHGQHALLEELRFARLPWVA